jgi:hypothetical protein
MVAAVAQMTSIPDRQKRSATPDEVQEKGNPHENIKMDELIREVVLSTHAFFDPHSPLLRDPDVCDLQDLTNNIAKPPMATSHKLATQVLKHIRSNPKLFREFNGPQLASVEAALTRRMTMIQGYVNLLSPK